MALYTIADLQDALADHIPSAAQEKLVRACNRVVRRISSEIVLPSYLTFTTRAKTTTGTVLATLASTGVTFSGNILSASDPIMLIQIAGESAWFTLTYVSASTGTLSSAWPTTTAATATFTIVYPAVSFPAAVGEIRRIWREGEKDLLFCADRGSEWVTMSVTGSPVRWSPYIHDSTAATPNDDLLRILLTPAPETAMVFQYAFMRRLTNLTPGGATTQAIPLPDVWWDCVIAGVLFFLWDQRDQQDRSAFWKGEYEREFQRVRGTLLPSAAVTPRVRRNLTVFSPNPVNP